MSGSPGGPPVGLAGPRPPMPPGGPGGPQMVNLPQRPGSKRPADNRGPMQPIAKSNKKKKRLAEKI